MNNMVNEIWKWNTITNIWIIWCTSNQHEIQLLTIPNHTPSPTPNPTPNPTPYPTSSPTNDHCAWNSTLGIISLVSNGCSMSDNECSIYNSDYVAVQFFPWLRIWCWYSFKFTWWNLFSSKKFIMGSINWQ